MNFSSERISVGLAVRTLIITFVSITAATTTAQSSERSRQSTFESASVVNSVFLRNPDDDSVNGARLDQEQFFPSSSPQLVNQTREEYFRPSYDTGLDGYFHNVGNGGAACLDGSSGCNGLFNNNPCPRFYGQVQGLFLMRHPQLNRQAIVVDPNTNTTFMSTSDLKYNYDPGIQATIGLKLCEGRGLEFTYFGVFDGSASGVVTKPNPAAFLTFRDNLVGNAFVDMDRVDVNYSSWINSFAVNLTCCSCAECGCGEACGEDGCGISGVSLGGNSASQSMTWFSGFRYLDLGEQMNMSTQRLILGPEPEHGRYNVRTSNHLYGAQMGGRYRQTYGRFGWDTTGTAGLFGNDAQQTQTVTDFPNVALRDITSNRSSVAFVGDANLSGLYRLSNVWNLRAGYNVMWIQGVALAPDQLNFNFADAQGGSHLNNTGGMLLHGVNFGVEARY